MNRLVEALKKWIEKREEGVERKGRASAISGAIPKTEREVCSERKNGEQEKKAEQGKQIEQAKQEKQIERAKANGKTEETLQAFSEEEKNRGGEIMRVVPVYNMMILPNSHIYFQIDNFRTLAGKTVEEGDKILLAVLHKNEVNTGALHKEEVHSIGLEGRIKEISKDGYAVVVSGNRVQIDALSQVKGEPLLLETTPIYDVNDVNQEEADRKLKEIKEELKGLAERFHAGKVMASMIEQHKSIQEVACMLTPWLSLNNEAIPYLTRGSPFRPHEDA